jgi:hypothetical protein
MALLLLPYLSNYIPELRDLKVVIRISVFVCTADFVPGFLLVDSLFSVFVMTAGDTDFKVGKTITAERVKVSTSESLHLLWSASHSEVNSCKAWISSDFDFLSAEGFPYGQELGGGFFGLFALAVYIVVFTDQDLDLLLEFFLRY